MSEVHFSEYLLDGYGTLGHLEPFVKNGIRYTIQRYQGKHKNEFTLRSESGDVYLFENNVLKQEWKEDKNGKKSEEFIRYKNGRADFSQRFQDILKQENSKRIVYHKKGLRMEIWSAQTGHLLYHGEYNEKQTREGWGIEYDEDSGNMVVEGIWSRGRLIEVIRCFNGDTMTELKRNGSDSLDPTKRIPIYVGGFRYDEDNETFVREGKGCLIDVKTGIATRECEWKDGKEVSGVDLKEGKYDPKLRYVLSTAMIPRPELVRIVSVPAPPKREEPAAPTEVSITGSAKWSDVNLQVTDLTISSNYGNDLNALDLNRFKWLQSIEIGDDCFGSVQTFQIDGLNRLKTIKIGINSFNKQSKAFLSTGHSEEEWRKGSDLSKSFHILNCESLESIQIGEFSFGDFGGEFELKNLPQLQSIRIGTIGSRSCNFRNSSFVIRGIELILNK